MEETESTRDVLIAWLSHHFGLVQIGVSIFFILLWFVARSREESKSRFKLREADRNLKFARGKAAAESANATAKKSDPLRLAGIVKDGAPHEVLGISALANESEIQKAYKERMKRYHPDLVGPDATAIAEAINRARNEMLERLKKRR